MLVSNGFTVRDAHANVISLLIWVVAFVVIQEAIGNSMNAAVSNGDRVARGPSVTVLDDSQGRIGTDYGAPVGARVTDCPDGRRIGLVRRRPLE